MKSIDPLVFCFFVEFVFSNLIEGYDNVSENELSCPHGRVCVPIDYCPGVETLMVQKALPAQRFRVAVCGYEATRPKVCCSPTQDANPSDSRLSKIYERPETRSQCGKPYVPVSPNLVTLGSFPFLARIGFINLITGEIKYPCVGTIINARTVLSTATCALAQSEKYKLHTVLVGEYDTSKNPDCNDLFCGHNPTCHKIAYVVKHPGFDSDRFANNIALIRLQDPMNFTVTSQPACIYTGSEFNLMEMDQLLLFGWGQLSIAASELRDLKMRLLSRQDCGNYVNQGLCVELCAIGEQEPCTGFSGSPIVRLNGNRYTVVGILSYGSRCEDHRNSPVALVDVQRYADWIAQN